MISAITGFVLIGATHFAAGVALYYGRVHADRLLFSSDFVVFVLPGVAALAAYFVSAWHAVPATYRLGVRLLIACVVAVFALTLSSVCIAMYAFGKYGT